MIEYIVYDLVIQYKYDIWLLIKDKYFYCWVGMLFVILKFYVVLIYLLLVEIRMKYLEYIIVFVFIFVLVVLIIGIKIVIY